VRASAVVHKTAEHLIERVIAEEYAADDYNNQHCHRNSGDPAMGNFSDAKVTRKFGDVSDDLSALLSSVSV
jgi:hypothetical protein